MFATPAFSSYVEYQLKTPATFECRSFFVFIIVAAYFSNKNLTFSTKIFQEELALIRWVRFSDLMQKLPRFEGYFFSSSIKYEPKDG